MIEAAPAAQLEIADERSVLAPEQLLHVVAEELEHVFLRGDVQVVEWGG
ncbi:MAG: hypothetical protein WA208_15245 [Thermoanaerobaculia bacterium]